MRILAIDTSCDETAVAVTEGRRMLSNVIYSQVLIHKKWGGVVPSLAKRAHEQRIDWVIFEALRKYRLNSKFKTLSPKQYQRLKALNFKNLSLLSVSSLELSVLIDEIDCVAVTYGPGLAPALEVGIKKAQELAKKYNKKLIAINHMEGHIYSPFVQNSKGNPNVDLVFPYLALLVSGGHTELILFEGNLKYKVLGATIDDAAGEALDKAAKLLGLGYPGGAVIERLAKEINNEDRYKFPRPMLKVKDLNFSFSGLKTAFYYHLKKMSEEEKAKNIKYLASSFQEAAFDHLLKRTQRAIQETGVNKLILGGGVAANFTLRARLRSLTKKYEGELLLPPFKYLCTDNAAMIGVAAHYHAQVGNFVKDVDKLDRVPRLSL